MSAPPIPTVLAWVKAHPGRAFAGFAALHAAVWTALPSLLYPNLPLDLIEALMYGREWQLGYDKLPPLPWWLVEIAYRLVGHDFAYYLLAEIAVVVAFAFVFLAARPLVGGVGALVTVLIVDGLHYVNYTAAKFNHDVIQLPFWALAGFAWHRALRERQLADWLLLGLAIGMSLWAKYFVVVLVAPMLVFALVDREARKVWATPGPWIAAALALVVVAPHLVWLVKTDFLPLAYAEHRAVLSRGWYDHFWHPLLFAFSQWFFLLPSLAIATPLFLPRRGASEPSEHQADAFDYRIVTWLAFGPIATVLAMAGLSGRGTVAMWGYPLWLFLGTWLVLTAQQKLDGLRLARILIIWAIVFVCLALAFYVNYDVLPRFDHRYRAVFFPGGSLGRDIGQRYRAATGKPPIYVIGTMWDGGNVEHYAPSHPRNLVDGEPQRAPWIDLRDLRAKGAAVVWTDSDPHQLPAKFKDVAAAAVVQPSFTLPYRRGPGAVTVGWAILQPQR
jgi:Dolichyl-phosphate-mannose-protein mannosyltransferase